MHKYIHNLIQILLIIKERRNRNKILKIIINSTIVFLFILMIVYIIIFANTFRNEKIPTDLTDWSNFSSFLSSVLSLANLILFTFLTSLAYFFQKEFSSRQRIEEQIKILTDYRITKLSELDDCLKRISYISDFYFNSSSKKNHKEWECNLTELLRYIKLFSESAQPIFNGYQHYNSQITNITNCLNHLISEMETIKYQKLNSEIKNINYLVVQFRNSLWEYTYMELKKSF